MTFKSLVTLALVQNQVAQALQLSVSEEEIATLLAQIDTTNFSNQVADFEKENLLNLAQLDASQLATVEHTCSTTHDRNKIPLPDFYNQATIFTDTVYPKADALYWHDYDSEKTGQVSQFEARVNWRRATDQFPDNQFWGTDGISPLDVRQGAVGDCWFMVAASALAEKPNRLEKVFLNVNGETNKNGIYAVNLYTLGMPHTVIVDDFLPLQKLRQRDGSFAFETLFAHITDDQSMWGVILEKAMAKVHGNYQHLVSGDPREATRALNGSPSLYHIHEKDSVTLEFLWSELHKHDKNNEMMFMNTPWDGASFTNECGLQQGHAYVALNAIELSNGARLVQMRNPWGSERYKCDYSDLSDKWTPELRKEAGATATRVNEGIFFMTIEDFYKQGQSTVISYDTTGWFYDRFLMLDDQSGPNGSWQWCGATCTRHIMQIESSVQQDVFVTAHTWEARTYPNECKNKNKTHSIYLLGASSIDTFEQGTHQMKAQLFKAGEKKQYVLEFDWSREGITPDWSVTAWAEQGNVSILHSTGKKSDTLPFIERSMKMQDPEEERQRVVAAAREAQLALERRAAEAAAAATAAAEANAKAEAEAKAAEEARLLAEQIQREFERWEVQKAEEVRLENERLAAEKAAREEAARQAALEAARMEQQRIAQEEAARKEQERIERERLERERLEREQAAKLEAERKAAEERARIEEARLAAEAEKARIAAEQARIAAEAEKARLAAEQARIAREQEEARRLAEQKRLAEEAEARRLAELARLEAERREQERILAAEQKARLEAQAREAERLQKLAIEKARQEREAALAAEQARIQALAEQRARQEEEARQRAQAEEEARLAAEAEKRWLAEQKRLADETLLRRMLEEAEQARMQALAEQMRQEQEYERKRLAAEEAARLAAKEAAEREAARKAAEEARIAAERQAARIAAEQAAAEKAEREAAEQARIAQEKEKARLAAVEQQRLREEAERAAARAEAERLAEQRRLAEEAEARKLAEEAEKARIAAENARIAQKQEAARVKAELARIAAEEEAARVAAEKARLAAEQQQAWIASEKARIAQEQEQARIQAEQQIRLRQEQQAAAEAEARRRQQEALTRRLEEEAEMARIAAEALAAREARLRAAAEERARIQEEQRQNAYEQEKIRLATEEAARQAQLRIAQEEAERQEEERRAAQEAEAKAKAREDEIQETEFVAQIKQESAEESRLQLARLEKERLQREEEQRILRELQLEEERFYEEMKMESVQQRISDQRVTAQEAQAEMLRQEEEQLRSQREAELRAQAAEAERRKMEQIETNSANAYDWSFLNGGNTATATATSYRDQIFDRQPSASYGSTDSTSRMPISSTTTREPLSYGGMTQSTAQRTPIDSRVSSQYLGGRTESSGTLINDILQAPIQTTSSQRQSSDPFAMIRQPISSTREPLSSTREPLQSTRQPLSSTRQPLTSTRQPLSSTREPLSQTSGNAWYDDSSPQQTQPSYYADGRVPMSTRQSANTVSAAIVSQEDLMRDIMSAPIRTVSSTNTRHSTNVRSPSTWGDSSSTLSIGGTTREPLSQNREVISEARQQVTSQPAQLEWWMKAPSPTTENAVLTRMTPSESEAPANAAATTSVQDELNSFVHSVPVNKLPGSTCNFNLDEHRDQLTDTHMIAAVHDCKLYGVHLFLYLKTEDLQMRIAAEYEKKDQFGQVVAANELLQCQRLSSILSKCKYYMAPDNPRMGIMLASGAYGLKFYTTNWVFDQQ